MPSTNQLVDRSSQCSGSRLKEQRYSSPFSCCWHRLFMGGALVLLLWSPYARFNIISLVFFIFFANDWFALQCDSQKIKQTKNISEMML